jgi:RNA recognition motif-containing protein
MIGYPPTQSEVYVGDLDPNVNEELLFSAFSRIGRIHSLKVMRHIVTGASRGFAFINFFNPAEATRAKQQMDGEKFFGRKMKVYLKAEYDSLEPNANIVFQNLPDNVTEEEVLKLLEPVGKPFSVKITPNEKTPGEAKAFAQFATMDGAIKAIERLNGFKWKDRELLVELTNRKNRVFVKARYHENAMAELRASLAEWKFEESESPEVSSDKSTFIVLLKFDKEQAAQRFLEEFQKDPKKCELIRPDYHQCCRQDQPQSAQGGLRERHPQFFLPHHSLPGGGATCPVQGGGGAEVRSDIGPQGDLTSWKKERTARTRSKSALRT